MVLKVSTEHRIFNNSLIQSLKNLDFDINNLYTHFAFLNFWFSEKKKVRAFSFRPLEYQKKLKIFKTNWKNTMQESCTKKVHFWLTLQYISSIYIWLTLHFVNYYILASYISLIGVSLSLSFRYYGILRFRRVYKILRNFPEIKIEFCKNLTLLHYAKYFLKIYFASRSGNYIFCQRQNLTIHFA